MPNKPHSHIGRYDSLVQYLRHLVDDHGVRETKALWNSDRARLNEIHVRHHPPPPDEQKADTLARRVRGNASLLYRHRRELGDSHPSAVNYVIEVADEGCRDGAERLAPRSRKEVASE